TTDMAEKKASGKEPKTYYTGTGRRKTAVARVRLTEGKGAVLINSRPLDDYFTEEKDRAAVLGPLRVTDQLNRVDVLVNVTGGGITGQAGAVSQGLARALKTMSSPSDEQKRRVFGYTTIIRGYRDEAKAREKAKAAPPPPPPPTRVPGQPLIPGASAPSTDGAA